MFNIVKPNDSLKDCLRRHHFPIWYDVDVVEEPGLIGDYTLGKIDEELWLSQASRDRLIKYGRLWQLLFLGEELIQ
jgi:hypothetical protein